VLRAHRSATRRFVERHRRHAVHASNDADEIAGLDQASKGSVRQTLTAQIGLRCDSVLRSQQLQCLSGEQHHGLQLDERYEERAGALRLLIERSCHHQPRAMSFGDTRRRWNSSLGLDVVCR
jgi:hypothetical protein